MHGLIALAIAFVSTTFNPSSGGELLWTQSMTPTPAVLDVNGNTACRVAMSSQECGWAAEVLTSIVDNGAGGKTLALDYGGTLELRNLGFGDVRLTTNGLPGCRVTLVASMSEPGKVADEFAKAATW